MNAPVFLPGEAPDAVAAPPTPRVVIAVLAHNEEAAIGACLSSLPIGDPAVAIHVLVNGSRDRTADIARARAAENFAVPNLHVHDWPEGGKARAWNRFVLDTPGIAGEVFVFVDGDAVVLPGSIPALVAALAADPAANAAGGLPANGRNWRRYRAEMLATRGLFGDLYALSGDFVARLRAAGLRLPEDLVGDDSLIGALAKTGLASEADWVETRVVPCPGAGFVLQPVRLTSPASLARQGQRMVNYAVRHYQNRIVTDIMRRDGPGALPRRLAEHYPQWLPRFTPRKSPLWWWFDRRALARMRRAMAAG